MDIATIEIRSLELADSDVGDFDTITKVVPWANEGQRKIVMATECLETSYTDTTVASTEAYDLQSDFWKMKRLIYNTKKAHFTEYNEYKSIGQASTGLSNESVIYTIWNGQFLVYTSDTIVAGLSVISSYFKWAADLVTSSSTTEIPDEYADLIPLWVSFRMAQANRESSLASERRTEFETEMDRVRRHIRRRRMGSNKIQFQKRDKYAFS